jgi:hypothetical protein
MLPFSPPKAAFNNACKGMPLAISSDRMKPGTGRRRRPFLPGTDRSLRALTGRVKSVTQRFGDDRVHHMDSASGADPGPHHRAFATPDHHPSSVQEIAGLEHRFRIGDLAVVEVDPALDDRSSRS